MDCIALLPAGIDWLRYCIQVACWLHCMCASKVKKEEQWYSSFQHWTIFFFLLPTGRPLHITAIFFCYLHFQSNAIYTTMDTYCLSSPLLAFSYSLMYCWWFLKLWKLCMMFCKISSCLMIHRSWRFRSRVFLALLFAHIWYRPSQMKTVTLYCPSYPKKERKKLVIIITSEIGGRKCLEKLAVGREISVHQQAPNSSLKHSEGAPNTKLTKQTFKYCTEREPRLPKGCWLCTLL